MKIEGDIECRREQQGKTKDDRKENKSKGGSRKCCKRTVSLFSMALQ